MSTTIQESTVIALGQRIGEILEERGTAFSIRAFSARIGLSKDMLARMISGDRYISPSDLQQIAIGLSLSPARIKQEDTAAWMEEITTLLQRKEKYERVVALSTEIKKVAVGCSERFIAADAIGRACYALNQYDEAHVQWLEAKDHAQRIANRYGNTDMLYKVLHNLVLSFTEKKDFGGISLLVEQLRPIFEPNPRRLGILYYSTASAAVHVGNYTEAKQHFLRSLELLQQGDKIVDVGRSEHNVAFMEYLLGNYQLAKEYFELAIPKLEGSLQHKLVSLKDYTKTLMKLGETDRAKEIIHDTLKLLESYHMPLRNGQFLMLNAITHGDIKSAQQVLGDEEIPPTIKRVACKYLMDHYDRLDDAENLLRYYRIAEEYGTNSAIYDEMGM